MNVPQQAGARIPGDVGNATRVQRLRRARAGCAHIVDSRARRALRGVRQSSSQHPHHCDDRCEKLGRRFCEREATIAPDNAILTVTQHLESQSALLELLEPLHHRWHWQGLSTMCLAYWADRLIHDSSSRSKRVIMRSLMDGLAHTGHTTRSYRTHPPSKLRCVLVHGSWLTSARP